MIQVLVQVVAGSSDKNFYNERTLEYLETRHASRPYPYPYGFIIGTRAADGDCVDCYLITSERLASGTIVECEPMGLLLQDEELRESVAQVRRGEGRVVRPKPS